MQRKIRSHDFSRLLSPRGVAVVGASEDERRIGGEPVRFLAEFGYRGKVYPVNPKRSEIRGLRCYPDVASLPQPCDVAVVAVAASHVPRVIEQCGESGIAFAVVLSAGFRETGTDGVAREAELKAAIDRSGVRVIGPNCLGLMNVVDRVFCGFGSGFQYPNLKPGPLAMVTQSGGFGATMMVRAQDAGVGMSYFVSNGNAVDISILELVDYFLERDDVEVVSMFIEGVPDGRRLREVGKRALELRKPILVCKAGNSESGRRAAQSHTATLTAAYALYRAAFQEGGFIEMRDADDLIDMARAFQGRTLPRGNRVVVVTGSGGAGVVASDRCEEYGMELPPLSEATLGRLRELLPGFAAASNPVDISGQRSQTGRSVSNSALEIVLGDDAADQVIIRSKQSTNKPENALELAQIAHRAGKPVLVALGADHDVEAMRVLDEKRIPWHVTIPRAAVAARALNDFARKLRRHEGRQSTSTRPVPHRSLDFASGSGTLGEHESKAVLLAYGIPVVREVLLSPGDVENLKALPEGLSFPLAVKIDSPDVPHKTEAGAVVLNVKDLAGVAAAAEKVCRAARVHKGDARINGVLLAQMASGLEMIVGAVNDPFFGPVVAVGLGGIFTDLLHDVTHRFAPFDDAAAREMIAELKGAPLLQGFRGQKAHDLDALAGALVRFSWLAADHAGRISEIDVNPLFVGAAGEGVLAADALVVLQDAAD